MDKTNTSYDKPTNARIVFTKLAKKVQSTVLLCFFLGFCIFSTVAAICMMVFFNGTITNSLTNTTLMIILLALVFGLSIYTQYYFYKLKRWNYFVGITESITKSKTATKQ